MKRWIHASRDIEYKVKDYIAAWAKDDVKEGKPMADFREFKEEMKSEGLKADEDSYDYYVACYNNAWGSSKKKVNASSDSKAIAENTSIDGRKFSDIVDYATSYINDTDRYWDLDNPEDFTDATIKYIEKQYNVELTEDQKHYIAEQVDLFDFSMFE